MTVKGILSHKGGAVVTVAPTASVHDAITILDERRIGSVVVTDSDQQVFQHKLGALPLATYQAGATIFAAGSKSGQMLILKSGVVAIVRENIEIAKVREPGAVLGELSALLDQPHTADVRALETSQFHVADASSFFGKDPIALHYVAVILARRLDNANQALIELKSQLQAGEPRSEIDKTVWKIETQIIGAGCASLVYAGYPFDPYGE